MAAISGKLAFCYVQPEWFRRGAGQALVADLESWLISHGLYHVQLNSTLTGEGFYRHLGYQPCAPTFKVAGLQAIPMCKGLLLPAAKADQGSKSSAA